MVKKHKLNDRNGEKYQKRLVMNQIKATKGITSYEARTIINSATEKKDAGKESSIRRGIENIEIKPWNNRRRTEEKWGMEPCSKKR